MREHGINKFKIVIDKKLVADEPMIYYKKGERIVGQNLANYTAVFAEIWIDDKKIESSVDLYSLFFLSRGIYSLLPTSNIKRSLFAPFGSIRGSAVEFRQGNGITPRFRTHNIEWRISAPWDGYSKILDKRFYSFDAMHYNYQLKMAWATLKEMAKDERAALEGDCLSLAKELSIWKELNGSMVAWLEK